MLERPNMYICYIFEKLGVQGCQIDIPMCQSPSTRPQPIQLQIQIVGKYICCFLLNISFVQCAQSTSFRFIHNSRL